jgi:hypothetical protein
VFLPPLIYAAAYRSSTQDLRANAGPIARLATGLVPPPSAPAARPGSVKLPQSR